MEKDEMRRGKRSRWTGLLLGVVLLLAACRPSPEGAGGRSAAPFSVECQVFYRASMAESFAESTVTLAQGGDHQVVEHDDLRFDAEYWDDEYEGQSLSIYVSDMDTGDELVRQLYQIDRAKDLVNQFVGGHGFTGLIYVYHPSSTAEMQYFCLAR
jgi:hypothetical protein